MAPASEQPEPLLVICIPAATPPGSREGPVPRFGCICGADGGLLSAMTRSVARFLPLFLLGLSGCVTAGTGTPVASSVRLEAPDETCERLGPMAVRFSTEVLLSEDALAASAMNELRERAALRGATNLVVAPVSQPAMVAYGTTGAASGVAYRCAE